MTMPRYAQDAIANQGQMGGMGAMGASGLAGLLGGMFGNSGAPYDDAMKQYQHWANRAQGAQNPFLNAGTGAIGNYQHWLQGMQDPSKFMNNMMGQYQESPWAHNLQQQAMRAGTNAASMGGLPNGMGGAGFGSTPFQMQAQQNASNISSQDMNNWLQNVLGINTQYGQGQAGMMGMGQNAANALTGMYGQMGQQMGDAAYGRRAGQNQDFMNILGGGLQMLPGALKMLPFLGL